MLQRSIQGTVIRNHFLRPIFQRRSLFTIKMKRIGIIACEDDEKYGGEAGYCDIFKDAFAKWAQVSPDKFETIHGVTGELPSLDHLPNYDAFILTGSRYSVNDGADWMLRLQDFVKACKENYDNAKAKGNAIDAPKVVALCFGHQLVNKALGGTIGNNPSGKFVFGVESIEPNNTFREKSFMKPLLDTEVNAFNLLQTHGECVLATPPNTELLASSKTCKFEIVQHSEGVIGLQGHPEMNAELMINKIMGSLKAKGRLDEEEVQQSLESFKIKPHSKEFLLALLRFISDRN